jgi:hypothetical protein
MKASTTPAISPACAIATTPSTSSSTRRAALTEALAMKLEAQRLGFQIMLGCMVGTSLAMAPAVLLAQDVEFVDLDGPLASGA